MNYSGCPTSDVPIGYYNHPGGGFLINELQSRVKTRGYTSGIPNGIVYNHYYTN